MTNISSRTRLFLLIGHPVDRSISPQMFNAVFENMSIDARYLSLDILPRNFQRVFPSLLDSGISGNITVPFKERASAFVDMPAEESMITGACNVFWTEGGMSCGDNTDIRGFLNGMPGHFRGRIVDSSAVILGAGGAARSVAFALLSEGIGRILILNRNLARGRDLASQMSELFPGRKITSAGHDETESPGKEDFPLLVNATSVGWIDGEAPAFDPGVVKGLALFYDVIYGEKTILMKRCEALNVEVTGGLEMLVQQGALSFSRWFGVEPPIEFMREAAAKALELGDVS